MKWFRVFYLANRKNRSVEAKDNHSINGTDVKSGKCKYTVVIEIITSLYAFKYCI